jgi:N-methylhydantoinase A
MRQGVERDAITIERSIDLRYIGQLHSVTVPIAELTDAGFVAAVAAFHDEHLRQYRYSHPENPVETSTLRVAARGQREKRDLRTMRHAERDRPPLPERERDVHFDSHGWLRTRVLDRNALASGDELHGPCVVEELDSTVVLPPATSAHVDDVGNIVIALDGAE